MPPTLVSAGQTEKSSCTSKKDKKKRDWISADAADVGPLNIGNTLAGVQSGNLSSVNRLFTYGIDSPKFGNEHIIQRFVTQRDPKFQRVLEDFAPGMEDLLMCIRQGFRMSKTGFYSNMQYTVRCMARGMGLTEEDCLSLRGWVFLVKEDQRSTTGKGFSCRYQSFKKAIAELEEVTNSHFRSHFLMVKHNHRNVLLAIKKYISSFGLDSSKILKSVKGIQDNITKRFKMYHMGLGIFRTLYPDLTFSEQQAVMQHCCDYCGNASQYLECLSRVCLLWSNESFRKNKGCYLANWRCAEWLAILLLCFFGSW